MGQATGIGLFAAALLLPLAFAHNAACASRAFMPTGGLTSQPIGHYEMCQRLPHECREITRDPTPLPLTRKIWAELIAVNNSVNTRIIPMTDMKQYGREDYWAYPDTGYGDCEDYALEKRRELMAKGVPSGDLLLTVVRQANGDGHAVLTVHTSLGDYILDNLEPRVLVWTDTDYRYLKRQSERNSGEWISIEDGHSVAVSSIR